MANNPDRPMNAKAPLTVYFHPGHKGDANDLQNAQSKAGADKIVLVDVTAGAALPAGLPAVSAGVVVAKDAAGEVYVGSDALFAAYSVAGVATWFKYVRLPGFRSTVGGAITSDGKSFGAR